MELSFLGLFLSLEDTVTRTIVEDSLTPTGLYKCQTSLLLEHQALQTYLQYFHLFVSSVPPKMLVLTLAAQIAVLASLGLASPVAKPQKRGVAVIPVSRRADVSKTNGEKLFNKELAAQDLARVTSKYANKKRNANVAADDHLAKRSGGEPFDIAQLRKRTVATESLTDDYDGIDERASIFPNQDHSAF